MLEDHCLCVCVCVCVCVYSKCVRIRVCLSVQVCVICPAVVYRLVMGSGVAGDRMFYRSYWVYLSSSAVF